mgnify:CR=1 FL=1
MNSTLYESLTLDMPAMAKLLRSKGRGNDKVLAHITKREAKKLKKEGGSGTINPDTGLPEFDDGFTPIDTTQGGITTEAGQGQPTQPAATEPTAPVAAQAGGDIGLTPGAQQTGGGIDFGNVPTGGPGVNLGSQAPARTGVQLPVTQPTTISDVAQQAVTPTPTPTTEEPSITDKLAKALGTTPGKLGLGLAQGAFGAYQASQAQKQGQQAKKEMQALATPYQEQGKQLVAQAQAGQLSPQSQQALDAAKAQLQQGIESRGGVGQAQAARQLQDMTANLLQNQLNLGLQISGIGDQIAQGAIKVLPFAQFCQEIVIP